MPAPTLRTVLASLCLLTYLATTTLADQPDATALTSLPVKEVTIFKDGHALVLHEDTLDVHNRNQIRFDQVPKALLGTVWAHVEGPGYKMHSLVAGHEEITRDHTAVTHAEFIRANVGKTATIQDHQGTHTGTILDVITHETNPSQIAALVKTNKSTRLFQLSQIRSVEFADDPQRSFNQKEKQPILTMRLKKQGEPPARARPHNVNVSVGYIQKGIRWIPNYRVTLGPDGIAQVELQATIINELTDLEDASAHLVVGAPNFTFHHTLSPMALNQRLAHLGQHFQNNPRTAQMLSNAMYTQHARMNEYVQRPIQADVAPAADLGPTIGDGKTNESQFIFTLEKLTLAKGERMIVPIAKFSVPYSYIFELNVPVTPPFEVSRHINDPQRMKMMALLAQPNVMQKLKLENKSKFPFTTAPILIRRGDQVIGQSLMTYTPIGHSVEVDLAKAINITVQQSAEETDRQANVHRWRGNTFDRIDSKGKITLTNRRTDTVTVRINRFVLGHASVSGDREDTDAARQLSLLDTYGPVAPYTRPTWWRWHSWPYWWHHVNGISHVHWTRTLKPGESAAVDYKWHYFWD